MVIDIEVGVDLPELGDHVYGVLGGLPALVKGVKAKVNGIVSVVVASERLAFELKEQLETWGLDAEVFPGWETFPHERLSPAPDTVGKRLQVLDRVGNGDDLVVVVPVRALMQPILLQDEVLSKLVVEVDKEYQFEKFVSDLVFFGYTQVDIVSKSGEFAVRGGIVDVFCSTNDSGVRVEFFGDEISDIRWFEVNDQRSTGVTKKIEVYPAREFVLSDSFRLCAGLLVKHDGLSASSKELITKAADGLVVPGMESLLGLLASNPDSGIRVKLLPEFFPKESIFIVDEPQIVFRRNEDLLATAKEFLDVAWDISADGGNAPLEVSGELVEISEVQNSALKLGFGWVDYDVLGGDGNNKIFGLSSFPKPLGDLTVLESLWGQWKSLLAQGWKIIVVCGGDTSNMVNALGRAGFSVDKPDGVSVISGALAGGFIADDLKLVVVAESELTGVGVVGSGHGRLVTAGGAKKFKRGDRIDPLVLVEGDLVVHEHHGVGRFVKLDSRIVSGAQREYVVLEYASSKRNQPGDRLFVPMESMDLLTSYIGGSEPSLNKLGGQDWSQTKRKARKAVRDIAAGLVELYAARQSVVGNAATEDTVWQRELEEGFEFVETPDQLTAISEVKGDMERPVPMDRVVVGDVGFGKTEVAVRAVFKAVQSGFQAAVLVPTTLLAGQHVRTFTERMSNFGIKVAGLSRFTDAKESKKIIADLASGEVDVVIGTHRLLQNGVVWKNLGLVVIDEEQRFGVEHKEHIKKMKHNVDVLSLSATPIPRTLEMSLTGIREMSVINTAPQHRHPILTYVGVFDEQQVAAAIRREILRDGQVFFVHNRVASIDAIAKKIMDLVPEARIAVAHGQMSEELLDRTVVSFWNREIDVLVCTTIVETGLDISNANTLIVDHSEILGLSQLHQLRGRVGRGRERGYAYFLYPEGKSLTQTAYDRLLTIAQNNDLGSGMVVAMKDLQIRGAGNVLGAEQSGHVAGVGFDLYVQMVSEAISAFKNAADGKPIESIEKIEVRIDIPVDGIIPPEYIPSERLRLAVYRQIAMITDSESISSVLAEITDRFGTIPDQIYVLVSVTLLRLWARKIGLTEIVVQSNQIRLSPWDLPESIKVRLGRVYSGSSFRDFTKAVSIPVPRTGGVGSDSISGSEFLTYLHEVLMNLHTDDQVAIPDFRLESVKSLLVSV